MVDIVSALEVAIFRDVFPEALDWTANPSMDPTKEALSVCLLGK